MKKNLTLILFGLLPLFAISQIQQAFNYQAAVRNSIGKIQFDTTVSFKIEILQNGNVEYSENHIDKETGKTGVVNFKVGEGVDTIGDFSSIDWSQGNLQIRTTLNGEPSPIGIADIVAVPIALYARSSGSNLWRKESGDIYYNQGKVGVGVDSIDVDEGLNGTLQINSIRPIILKNNGGSGVYGSEIGFNAVLKTGEVPNKFIKLGGTLQEGGAVQAVDKDGNIHFQMYNAETQDESIIDYDPNITFTNTGNIGIGIQNPNGNLQVNSIRPVIIKNNGGNGVYGSEIGFNAVLNTDEVPNKFIKLGGTQQKGGAVQAVDSKGNMFFQMYNANTDDESVINFSPSVVFKENGRVGIGTVLPDKKLHVEGTTKTKILEITGGGDGAEYFNVIKSKNSEPGSLVIIDDVNEGKLKISSKAYDIRIAGVISGAGGVNPGITLEQKELLEGDELVSLWGRVYVKATTENGKIKPGDLLTSSNLEGHAMKATKKKKSRGAIIGKALSNLEEGEGLVLILIQPQ